MCNRGWGGAFLNGRVWDTFILFAMHVTLLYKTESNNLKKMDGEKKKGARKQICFQICMPGAGGGGSNSEMQSEGGPGHWQPGFAVEMALVELELRGGRMQDSPELLHGQWEYHTPSGTAWLRRRETEFLPWGVPGGREERDGEEVEMFSSAFRYIFSP